MNLVDLHVHSTASDGTYTPTMLVDYAMEKGLSAFALTDHDTINGIGEAVSYAESLRDKGINAPEVIPGTELSTEYKGGDVHIVGLYINWKDPKVQGRLKELADGRTERNRKMCSLLQGAGMDITYEKLLEEFPESVITRAHYAKYMLKCGYVSSISEAFDKYIGDGCPYFVPREKVTPGKAIRLILEAGGIPVLAHPVLYHLGEEGLDELVAQCKEEGLMGIEVYYSTYTAEDENDIMALAKKYDLLVSGGSDFHGDNKPGLDMGCGYGSLRVPESVLEGIKSARHA